MARIPEAELEQLKREVDLVSLVRARGVELHPHGSNLLGLCPFHDDKEPSLVVTPGKNLWHCLGACQSGGSVIDWVMKAEGASFRHAVELLRAGAPSLVSADRPLARSASKLPCPVELDADDQVLLDQVVTYYHETLKESPEAQDYLRSRGLDHGEAVDRFRLGYANRTLAYRLPAKNRKAGAEVRGRLQRLGVLRASGHEHLNGSLVIPVLDESGHASELYGRKVGSGFRKDTPLHLYLPGPHRGVWNLPALKASREIILCESLIDALTFWCAGHRNVTAAYGVEGFTPDLLSALQAHGVRRVLVAYDRDGAGDPAAESLAKKLNAVGIGCRRVQFPKGMDANEYALKVQPAAKSLGLLLRTAVALGQPDAVADGEVEEAAKEEQASESSAPELESAPAPASSLAASAEPSSPPAPSPASGKPRVHSDGRSGEVRVVLGDRRYRVRGLDKNLSFDVLRTNLQVRWGEHFHLDTLDLYSARHRASYVKAAAEELGCEERVLKKDLGKLLLELECLQEARIKGALEPKPQAPPMTPAAHEEALGLLEDPRLLERIVSDFDRCGVVGEETNKLAGYLAAVSRKLEQPLAVVIQSSSAAGKSALMESVLSFVPCEDSVKYSAMTGQSLFYMGEADLKHKVLAIVEEEGAERASYALKLLQSEGELTIASTGKDPATGKLQTHEYRVEGPVAILLTTTSVEVDEELLNRCLVLTVDEDRAQTQAIHRLQRESQTLEGLLARRDRERILKVHRNAQRLLRPLLVANPYARELTFLDDRTRMRRDHVKYLTLIRTIALLHQYQRPVKSTVHQGDRVEYIEVQLSDIAMANRLAGEVLGRSLDELPPQTRRLLGLLSELVASRCVEQGLDREDFRFSRREVRERIGWGDTQLKVHLHRLTELEYLVVHSGGRGQSFVYELVYQGEGDSGRPFLPGLLDVEQLKRAQTRDCDSNRSGQNPDRSGAKAGRSGSGRPLVGPRSGGGRGSEDGEKRSRVQVIRVKEDEPPKNAVQGEEKPAASYSQGRRSAISSLAAAPGRSAGGDG